MKTSTLAVLVTTLAFACLSQAQAQSQAPGTEIRESTDPARVADVEQRAADLQARQQAARMETMSGDSGTSGNSRSSGNSSSGSGSPGGSGESGKSDRQHSGHGGGHGSGHGTSGGQGGASSHR